MPLLGFKVIIISEHDNGEQVRRHRKKRINKKWLKRYGVYSGVPLERGQISAVGYDLYMTRGTYRLVKESENYLINDVSVLRQQW